MNREAIGAAIYIAYLVAFVAAIHKAETDRYEHAYRLLLGAFLLGYVREWFR